jgi:Response regulator receiver domain
MITPFTSAIRNNNKPRILIVDDNPRFSHSARLILQQSGQYVVCEENDAAGAVETARSFRPDLTLLDLIMPGVDGAEVAAQIESDWGWLSGLLWYYPYGYYRPYPYYGYYNGHRYYYRHHGHHYYRYGY